MALREELRFQGDFLFRKRSYLPLLLLVFGIGAKIYQTRYFPHQFNESTLLLFKVLCVLVGLSGLVIRIHTVGYSKKNTSGRNTKKGQEADFLNTKGLYSLTRNPLYLGNYLMWLAIAMATGNIWFVLIFTLAFWIYYERIIYAEEAFLRNKFGKTYLDWANQTPVFLPRHLHYRIPETSFSWKKVIKKEKNGLFALFLLLFIFNTIDLSVKHNTIKIEMNFISITTLISGILYFVLKYLKKRTSVLNEEKKFKKMEVSKKILD